MTKGLSPMVSRIAAVGLLIVALLGIHALIVQPIVAGYSDNLDAIEQVENALRRYRATGGEAPALAERLHALQTSGPAGYLEGADETMTAAALQNRLQMVVGREGAQLKSVQVLPTKPEGAATRIAVRGQMVASIGTLQRVMYQIENSFLFVDNLEIRAVAAPRGEANAKTDMPLDVRFDVYGYMQVKS